MLKAYVDYATDTLNILWIDVKIFWIDVRLAFHG